MDKSGTTRPIERQRVLVVDDEEDIRNALRDTIEAYLECVDVLTAPSGEAALELLRERPAHLIISDYRMPGMDGLRFLFEARRLYPEVPRIMITAFPDIDLAIRALQEDQIVNFIPKPLRRENIVVAVASTLHERRTHLLRSKALSSALEAMRVGFKELRSS